MKETSTVIILYVLVFGLKTYAQDAVDDKYPDYIITLNNDTVKCKIRHKLFTHSIHTGFNREYPADQNVKYEIPGTHGSKDIDPDSVKAYFLSGDTSLFLSKHLNNATKPLFVKVIEQGELNLYQYRSSEPSYSYQNGSRYQNISGGEKSIEWYVGKTSTATAKLIKTSVNFGISDKEFELFFGNMLADNADLLARFKDVIKTTEYDWDLIRAYVKIYNDEYMENHKAAKSN